MGGNKKVKVLVTGAKGFVGKNLVEELRHHEEIEVYEYDLGVPEKELDFFCKECDFIYHLAGVNRPLNTQEFKTGNYDFTVQLMEKLKRNKNYCPVMLASSIQASQKNPYGESKKAGEEAVKKYHEETGAEIYIYRFSNLFGKWCRPNYNSVVATFCYNIAHDLPIRVDDEEKSIKLVYIDDVIQQLLNILSGKALLDQEGFCIVPQIHEVTLGKIRDLLYSFKASRRNKEIPDMSDRSFSKQLYSTYLSYLPEDQFSYPLKMNIDERGSFTEIIRTPERGQISVNISKPGIEKGNHWHHTKNEKFIVVSGQGLIQFRRPDSDTIISYYVSGEKIEVVDIPVGYTHNIINTGKTDLVTLMWCNECFNPEKPDTYFLKVDEDK